MKSETERIDVWTELERAGEVPAPADEILLTSRAALRRAAGTETLRADVLRIRRRRRTRAAALIGGAIAASVALGVMTVDIGGRPVGASPAAAAVLERAADATLATSEPVVGPGQYLRITLVEQSWSADRDDKRDILIGSDGKPVVYQERRTRQIWVPHDRRDDWVIRDGSVPLRSISKDAAAHNTGVPTETWTVPSWAGKGNDTYIKTYDPAWYATLPRDPERLLARLKAEDPGESGSSASFYFQEVFSEVLRSGIAPADIRAALFEALAATPGMDVVDGVANLDGRRGVAIGYRDSNWQMVFDRATGLYIGERATSPDFPDVPGLDEDKTTWLTSVRTDVVDEAPGQG
ncbi:MAG: hypothetical protein JWO11_3210 [Nocardioides sp.]|nr:hypothetical protein [Nocardioides sp.]